MASVSPTTEATAGVVIYARQSQSNDRSIDQQAEIGGERAVAEGWAIRGTYRDGVSASRYATKQRIDWPKLLTALELPDVNVLWLWETSRGDRNLTSWSAMLDRCREHDVRIHVETHGRLYDLSRGRDWRTLAEDGVANAAASSDTSDRTRRDMADAAGKGRPHGRVPYGYRRRYEQGPRGPVLVAQEPHTEADQLADIEAGKADYTEGGGESAVVVELYERVDVGHSFRGIANDFEARGIRRRDGKVFSPTYLRDVVLRDLYRGKRVHVTGRRSGRRQPGDDAEITDGSWPELIPEALWQRVFRKITDPSRKTRRPGRAKHLLSLIVGCDRCSSLVIATYKRGPRQYHCREKGCVAIDADELDLLATEAIITYLSRPDIVELLAIDDKADGELARARDVVAAIRAELDELADQVGRGEKKPGWAVRAEPQIQARLDVAEARAAELTRPSLPIAPGAGVRERWEAAPISARREVARAVLSPELLGELRVTRTPTRGVKAPAQDRVTWRHG